MVATLFNCNLPATKLSQPSDSFFCRAELACKKRAVTIVTMEDWQNETDQTRSRNVPGDGTVRRDRAGARSGGGERHQARVADQRGRPARARCGALRRQPPELDHEATDDARYHV